MKSKILRIIIGMPFVMVGVIVTLFISGMFSFFGWLFRDDTCYEIAEEFRRLGWNPITFLKRVWK